MAKSVVQRERTVQETNERPTEQTPEERLEHMRGRLPVLCADGVDQPLAV